MGAIRYRLDILQALRERGITSYRILRDGLIPQGTMTKIRRGDTGITLASVATLCRLLDCQPGDLLEYVPDEDEHQPGQPDHHQDAGGGASGA